MTNAETAVENGDDCCDVRCEDDGGGGGGVGGGGGGGGGGVMMMSHCNDCGDADSHDDGDA